MTGPYQMPRTRTIESSWVLEAQDLLRDPAYGVSEIYNIELERITSSLFHTGTPMRTALRSNRTITINRTKLLEKLKENRAQHEKIYLEALEGYREAAGDALRKIQAETSKEARDLLARKVQDTKAVDWSSLLDGVPTFPENALKAYDEAIQLFEWDEAEDVKLGVDEFRSFVLDEWDWTARFLSSNSHYSRTARARAADMGVIE